MKTISSTLSIGETAPPTISEGAALVRIKCFALSPEDVALYEAQVSVSKLGAAFAGMIVAIKNRDSSFNSNDRVMGFLTTGGAMSEYIACDTRLLIPIPQRLEFEYAALILNPWITAIQILMHDASFKKRERLVVFDANTPNGQAVVQLAQLLGCRRVHCVTNPSLPEVELSGFRSHGALPDEVVVHNNPEKIADIARYDPKGLEVSIDLSASPRGRFEIMRPHGRIVWSYNIDMTSKLADICTNLELSLLKNLRIQGSSLRSQNPLKFQSHLDFLSEHIAQKFVLRQLKKPKFRLLHWSMVGSISKAGKTESEIHVFSINTL